MKIAVIKKIITSKKNSKVGHFQKERVRLNIFDRCVPSGCVTRIKENMREKKEKKVFIFD